MSILRTRLGRLERQIGSHGIGKLIVARSGPDTDELNAMLADQGIDCDDPRHTVVILRTIFEDQDGGVAPKQMQTEILSITEMK